MKKQILFIGSFLIPKNGHYGGVYFASTSLRDKMVSEGFEVIELDTTLKDISVTKVSKRLSTIIARSFRFLKIILLSPKAKTIFIFVSRGNSYLDKFPSFILAKFLRKKIILFPLSGHLIEDFEKPFYIFFIKKILNSSTYIICQSTYWKNYFKSKGVPTKKLKTVENWVPNETIKTSRRIDFGNFDINKDKCFRMVYVSRIEIAKGINDIVEAAKTIPKGLIFKIDIFGEGAYKDEFIKLIKHERLEEVINYKGWLDNSKMQATLNKYHLALFTSRVEGYPNSLLDFIFSKIPVIAYDIPSVRAVGQEYTLYYKDISSLVSKIVICYNDYENICLSTKKLYKIKRERNNIAFTFSQLENFLK